MRGVSTERDIAHSQSTHVATVMRSGVPGKRRVLRSDMAATLRISFARWCRQTRIDLDITQRELADAVGVSRTYVVAIEAGTANPSMLLVERIGEALGLRFELVARRPILVDGRPSRDLVHARCSAYVHRRLVSAGFQIAREIEVVHGRTHGWIDILAFDERTGTMLIIEVKTVIDDVGQLERQLGFYERLARMTDQVRAWDPRRVQTWLLGLASHDVDTTISQHADLFRRSLPMRAPEMRTLLTGIPGADGARGVALIDPRSRRLDWLIATRSDGRRSPSPYRDRVGAERLLIGAAA